VHELQFSTTIAADATPILKTTSALVKGVRTSALISVSSRLGFRAGAATPSGVMISFRPPRRCSRIGMRMVRVSSSRAARPVITLPYPVDARGRRWCNAARARAMQAWLSLLLSSMAQAAGPPASPPRVDR
jgi:hypothetical protein